MKKIILSSILLMLVFTLVGCLSTPKLKPEDCGSPEECVLVYGFNNLVTDTKFAQMDPTYPPHFAKFQMLTMQTEIITNVVPGSRYQLLSYEHKEYVGNTIYYITTVFGVDGSDFDFLAPEKPGLYYYNQIKNPKEASYSELMTSLTIESKNLKDLVKFFKGSAWEELIVNRLDEVTISIEELKNKKEK